ncbi:MAG TPA: hypothetical protein VHL80_19215 [Polyangia bacterium]|nr:hypothetical protein [Polyangia bacterium]
MTSCSWRRRARWIAVATALLGGGCATAPLDATDARYVRGARSFEADHWAEARASLASFLEARCEPAMTGPGCQKALWLKMRSELAAGLPARAVEDALGYGFPGAPRRELRPTVFQLRRAARAEVAAQWASPDRSVQIEIVHDDDVARRLHPLRVTYSIDGERTLPVPEERWLTRDPVAYVSAPPGGHFVDVECLYAQQDHAMRVGSTKAFDARPNDTIVIVARIHEAPRAPGGRALPVVDFDVTARPEPAARRDERGDH